MKIHTQLDLRGDIPSFFHITKAKTHDVNFLGILEFEAGAFYLTNNFDLPAIKIADLYKHRWQIEIFFKWIKQHLKIEVFWGRSINAVKIQICIAICTFLLVAILKKELKIKRDLYEILQILAISQFEKTPINTLVSEFEPQSLENHAQKRLFSLDF